MSEHVDAVVAHYDDRSATYDEDALHRDLVEVVAGLPALADASVLLDVACGTGLLLRALARRRDDRVTIGLDRSLRMLEAAARALPGARLLRADAAALPVADRSADAVACVTALHLLEDPAAFAEWARVLAPGGVAVTATFGPADEQSTGPGRGGFVRNHAPFRSADRMVRTVAPHGLRLADHTWWTHGEQRLLICVLGTG